MILRRGDKIRFCSLCFGKQMYRAGFNPVRKVKIKCSQCGQGADDGSQDLKGHSMNAVVGIPICAFCGKDGADMECNPVVHPVSASEYVHEECLREFEDRANVKLCEEIQRHGGEK